MRNPVECFLRFSRVILLVGIALAATGDRLGWASRTRAPNMVSSAAADLAGRDPAEVAPALSMAESGRQMPGLPTALDVTLVGTAVVEGGPSFAVFEGARGSRVVREGEEIAPGVRLVQVDWNWVDVERGGIRHEIRLGSREAMPGGLALGSSGGMADGIRVSSISGAAAPDEASPAPAWAGVRESRRQAYFQWIQEMRDQRRYTGK